MTGPISFEEIVQRVIDEDLIGYNIHYNPTDGTWMIWTRKRGSDGWNRSGWCESLEDALRGCMNGPSATPDWMELI